MKKLLFNFCLLTTILFSISSCEKYEPAEEIKDAKAYTITSLKLEKISMTDPAGYTWNSGLFGGSNPDIYFKIQDENNSKTYYTSDTRTDVSSSNFPITWSNLKITLDIDKEYRICFFDKDGSLDEDDVMSNCVWLLSRFDSRRYSDYYPWSSSKTRFTVELSWLY